MHITLWMVHILEFCVVLVDPEVTTTTVLLFQTVVLIEQSSCFPPQLFLYCSLSIA